LAVVGVYFLNKLFLEILEKTSKEHYSFEKAITEYAKGKSVKFAVTNVNNLSLKYPWEVLLFKDKILSNLKKSVAATASIASSAELIGEVFVDENATVIGKFSD